MKKYIIESKETFLGKMYKTLLGFANDKKQAFIYNDYTIAKEQVDKLNKQNNIFQVVELKGE